VNFTPSIQLPNSKFSNILIKLALRLHPIIAVTFRWAARDTTLPTGGGPDGLSPCFVPRGRRIMTSFNALHHREDIWGPTAAEFNPERWLQDEKVTHNAEASGTATTQRLKTYPKWTYMPFGGGMRICPGQYFAMVEAQYTIIRMLQVFRRIECRDDRPYAEVASIAITLKSGTLVALYDS
jgi:cytochrome P450